MEHRLHVTKQAPLLIKWCCVWQEYLASQTQKMLARDVASEFERPRATPALRHSARAAQGCILAAGLKQEHKHRLQLLVLTASAAETLGRGIIQDRPVCGKCLC